MHLTRTALCACVILLPTGFVSQRSDDLSKYLTKEGNMVETLEIFDLQGGVAGFTGTFMMINKDGTWRAGQMLLEKMAEEKSGKLGKDELATLAKALAMRDLLNLDSKGESSVNPHIVTIRFGKTVASLTLPAGSALPKVDTKAAKLTVEERYSAIIETMRQLQAASKK